MFIWVVYKDSSLSDVSRPGRHSRVNGLSHVPRSRVPDATKFAEAVDSKQAKNFKFSCGSRNYQRAKNKPASKDANYIGHTPCSRDSERQIPILTCIIR